MKMNGVSGSEKTDTLFFQAAGIVSAGSEKDSFQSVLQTSKAEQTAKKETLYTPASVRKDEPAAEQGSGQTEQVKQAADEKEAVPDAEAASKKADKSSPKKDAAAEKAAEGKGATGEEPEENVITQEIVCIITVTIRQIVIEGASLTPEQLEDALKACDLNELQLLDPQNLQKLLLSMTQTGDVTEFLTDESLINTYQVVENALAELSLDDYGISREQLKQFMEAAQQAALSVEEATMAGMPDGGEDAAVSKQTLRPETAAQQDPLADKLVVEDQRTETAMEMPADAQKQGAEDETAAGEESRTVSERTQKEPFHKADTVTGQFAQQLAEHSTTVTGSGTETVVMYRQIVTQIVEQVRVVIRPDQTHMTMQLEPENLGKLMFQVTAKQGAVTAHFVVENELAKEAIEANLEVLKQTLQEQGTKVESVEVTISDFSLEKQKMQQDTEKREEQNENPKNVRKQIRLEELEEAEELSQEDEVIANAMLQSGATVEFRA